MASPQETLKALDGLLSEFFAPVTSNERKRDIESMLQNFTQLSNAWEMCLFFLSSSSNEYVQMFCLNVLENNITHKWLNMPTPDKSQIKSQLNQFLLSHHTTVPSYIRNKLAKLVVDIGRSDWPHFYPDFFSSILQLAQQPDTALLGVILLQTASEELASPRDDLSMARKDELQRLLLQQVPAILSVLNSILEAMLEKHRHVIAATPPPSPTSGEGRSKSPRGQQSDQLFSSSPIANANFVSLLLGSPSRGPQMEALPPLDPAAQQLCWHGLTCLAQYLSWVPLSSVIRPQLLSTIFHFAAFGCQPRPDAAKDGINGSNGSPSFSRPGHFSSTTHKLGVLAMNCINEILSKNCVPQEFEDFLLQMFQQTFNLLKKITKESNTSSSGNRLQELDEVYVEKFTDFLRLFVSVHLRRFESNPQFPVLELLSLLFKYTFRQPSTEGYYSCLDIWNTFLDYLTSKLETRAVAREEIISRYKEALTSLMSNILQKLQFRFNQSELEELDDDTLDDDDETEWQHFLRQNLEVVAKVAEVMTADVFQLLWDPFQEYVETYFGVEKFVDNSPSSVNGRRLCIMGENDCRRLHCALRDLSSLLQALGRLAVHFIGETFVARFENAMQIVTRLVQVMAYGSRHKLFELTTSAAVLQQDFIEVHAQSVAAIKAYAHWMAQFYAECLRTNHQKEEFKSFVIVVMEALTPLVVKGVPEKILQSSAHLLLSITTTVRPSFLLEVGCVQALYDKISQGAVLELPQEIQHLVIRSLSHHLVLPWPSLPEGQQNWTQRAAHHKSLVARLTSQFTALCNLPDLSPSAQEQGKPVIKHTMVMCQDLVESITGEIVRSKKICWESLAEVTQTALTLFPVYIHQTEAIEPIVSYFLSVFRGLRVQMGVAFTEKIMHMFMTVFSRDLLAQTIHQETNVAFRLIENFLKILQLIVQEPGSQFKPFLSQILTLAMDQVYPIIAPRQSPDMKSALFKLLHEILVNNWRYFFKTSVLDAMKEAGDTLENSVQFTAILQAYGHSFLQTDISIFKQNLESLESLHFKCKLYNKRIFREVMCHQFLKVLLEVLIRKSHDLLQEEIVISIYNMAASNFDDFFHNFLQQFLTALNGLDNNQKAALAKNFKVDTDLPSFTQAVQRFVNDIRYYNIINTSLPVGSVTFS